MSVLRGRVESLLLLLLLLILLLLLFVLLLLLLTYDYSVLYAFFVSSSMYPHFQFLEIALLNKYRNYVPYEIYLPLLALKIC